MASLFLDGLDGCRALCSPGRFYGSARPAKGRTRADYHNGPVNGFGDLQARVCLLGLAPGAHGANRTGRPFTGDGAGISCIRCSTRPASPTSRKSSLQTMGWNCTIFISPTRSSACHPRINRTAAEFAACRAYLEAELQKLQALRVIIVLGHGAHNSLLRLFQAQGLIKRLADVPFGHGAYSPAGQWPHVGRLLPHQPL